MLKKLPHLPIACPSIKNGENKDIYGNYLEEFIKVKWFWIVVILPSSRKWKSNSSIPEFFGAIIYSSDIEKIPYNLWLICSKAISKDFYIEIPEHVKSGIKFIPVKTMDEVYKHIFA